MSSMTKISVIVPSYNRAHYLEGALKSLTCQETDGRISYEVVIVDNASTDNTREVVQGFAAHSSTTVRYLHEPNPGDAPPRNKGIRETDGDWLAFFDDDQFAEPRWLLNMLEVAEQQNTTVVGGPVHLDLDDAISSQFSQACRNTLREMKPYPADQPYEIDVIPGTGNLLIARRLFEEIGLFSESIKEGGSDWKLVNDARAAGVIPWYASKAKIRHRVEGNRMTPQYFRWDAQNGGVAQANVDFRRKGGFKLTVLCAARLLRAFTRLPQHLLSKFREPAYGATQGSMIWWRTKGYVRGSLTLLAPNFCPQKKYHEYVEFRSGRVVGT